MNNKEARQDEYRCYLLYSQFSPFFPPFVPQKLRQMGTEWVNTELKWGGGVTLTPEKLGGPWATTQPSTTESAEPTTLSSAAATRPSTFFTLGGNGSRKRRAISLIG